ncbi:hypothetical protein AA958_29435 [Streptomyces sp. CNQ-509]|uniref:hypothetical protein n=1 Tax=Streptomyces sp. CNQ-509 TaxID=444103 RepID=UPI00062DF045|nr:hypothetical protein [Streptomyces sp. CNQ-509]AKH85680.1 hypothetical protein AA958_29435 [Streptomyces sp. CNQ-509]
MTSSANSQADTASPACCGAPAAAPAPQNTAAQQQPREVLIITDSCCNPAAAPAEERAVKTVTEAITATGSPARARLVSATEALAGALSPEILAEIQSQLVRGTARPPMVMIAGQIVASGNFTQQEVEAALAGTSA